MSVNLSNFRKIFIKNFHENFARSFQVFLDVRYHEIRTKGNFSEAITDPNTFLNITMPSLKKTIHEYFQDYINN